MTDPRIAEIQAQLNATRAIYELGDFLTESEVLDLVGSSEFLLSRLAEAEGRIAAALALAQKWEMRAGPDSDAERVFPGQVLSVMFAVDSIRAALSVSPEPEEGDK